MYFQRPAIRVAAAAVVVMAVCGGVMAYPKPDPVPPRWELEFRPGDLRLYVDRVSNGVYWYLTYKVTNRTGRAQVWAPTLVLFSDSGEIIASGRGVSTRIVGDLRELLGNELLENQNEIIGEIFHGREHAREGLVVWPARRLDVNEMSMFVAGISGETATVTNPITGEVVVLRKTLQRDYLIAGDALPRGSRPVDLVQERWVMR